MTTKDRINQADWLAALAEPTRLAIVAALAAGPRNVTQLAAAVGAEIANVSHHLGVLRTAKVVTDAKSGRFVVYTLAAAKVAGGTVTLTHPSGAEAAVPLA
ncbi:ArsR/SmtB family transcription factor [Gemmata sp.]|uniref:ArsR/SmtB family transcription factor n=1 Tax=Gemmata sp. TaxID=1914242 RepID=UPI003F730707